jgi:hypothetical protein
MAIKKQRLLERNITAIICRPVLAIDDVPL